MATLSGLLPPATRTTCHTATSRTRTRLAAQVRHATFIPRPRRPYTFTQLVQLSDGSTYTARTTSPAPLYRPTKDTRNTLLWQPSEKSLRNVELDEAGKLAAFRERFGRAFDAAQEAEEEGAVEAKDGGDAGEVKKPAPALGLDYADLIAGYASAQDSSKMKDSGPKQQPKKRK